ncbi:hypothetical protein Y1Q_0012778 [Alligator mississippiensis]|uniref:Uncharacterized protein n=1 Tax=Alligator mississippiensis TaxID=8496 RepID=A0A151M1A4_ALLMI|nr:hypothetical protein Y1Q_0012778 [Alligator mississippiensis]
MWETETAKKTQQADASGKAIGAVLSQAIDGLKRPVAYVGPGRAVLRTSGCDACFPMGSFQPARSASSPRDMSPGR